MRRLLPMLFILILTLACRTLLPTPEPTVTVTAIPATLTPTTALPSPTPSPTLTPSPLASTVSPTPTLLYNSPDEPFTVIYHPDGPLYSGDVVSLEVIAPGGMVLPDAQLSIQVDSPSEVALEPVGFGQWGIQGRWQATLVWGWDTTGLAAGEHRLTFTIQPQGYWWEETIVLLPTSELPSSEAQAQWAEIDSRCCKIHYITGTAAERDLDVLVELIDEQALQAAEQMGTDFVEPVSLTILPRLLGHGGFASAEINVSYLDRNYAANDWEMVVHHELIHILDRRLGGDLLPSMLVEGLAVYMTGGHYKPEPLLPRAAALLFIEDDLGGYLPLVPLANDFYTAQHEIGYLQAGALVEYMVDAWGWQAFSTFYRDIHPIEGGNQAQAIDAALQVHFGLTFAQLEQEFIAALEAQPDAAEWKEDVRLTVIYYDTLRRYQQLLDPSAYFATAWLMDSAQMRERGILADILRHPETPTNLALETMLITAGEDLYSPPSDEADLLLAVVNAVLDAAEEQSPELFSVHPLAEDYFSIVQMIQQAGFLPQLVRIEGDLAHVWSSTGGLALIEITLMRYEGSWIWAVENQPD